MNSSAQVFVGFAVAIAFILSLWALIDLLRRPHWAFQEAHVNRMLWLVLLALSWICGIGLFIALFYLFLVAPKVSRVQQLGARPGFPGRT